MINVHILGNIRSCYTRHLHPVRVFKKELLDSGINVRYFSSPLSKKIYECDALIFMEASYRNILPIEQKDKISAVDYLSTFLKRFQKVIWFDDHDSSGMLRTYVFPLVTYYAKAQLTKDFSYYQQNHLTGIPHLDFVNENFNLQDVERFKGIIDKEEKAKLRLSWNLAMVNWKYLMSDDRIYRRLILRNTRSYDIHYNTKPLTNRRRPFSYRASMWNNIPLLNWWRETTKNRLSDFLSARKMDPSDYFSQINRKQYHQEMADSIVTPSPFGFGEICYRDFEGFINGSLVLKPRMDHMITWPSLYIDGVTYISHKWDFSDFNEKLDDILLNPARYEDLAREGQKRFKEALSDGYGFAKHFLSMINFI